MQNVDPDITRIDSLASQQRPLISFEFFPPKTDEGTEHLYRTIDRLKPLNPAYVSVTYGAGGSERVRTLGMAERIQGDIGIRTMLHLTCVEHKEAEITEILDRVWEAGIRNIIALRGDPPGGSAFQPTGGDFGYAGDLVRFISSRHDFCIAVAGYPEGHPQCLNRTRDLEHLKQKIDQGGDLIITQLFFDNDEFYRWRDQTRDMGIKVPIIAGIMPVLNVAQIKRFITRCGAKIPHPLLLKIEAVEDDEDAVYKTGVEYAIEQCRNLIESGEVDGIHFYTLNRSRATVDICRALQDKLPAETR